MLLLLLLLLLLLRHDGPVGGSAASRLLDLEVGNAVPDVLPDETLGRLEQRQFGLLVDAHLELDVVLLPNDEVGERIPELVKRRLEVVPEGWSLVILERAVGKDAFGEIVEERHGKFVVDGSLVRRRVVENLANPIRLLVVMQKLVDEGNVYLQNEEEQKSKHGSSTSKGVGDSYPIRLSR